MKQHFQVWVTLASRTASGPVQHDLAGGCRSSRNSGRQPRKRRPRGGGQRVRSWTWQSSCAGLRRSASGSPAGHMVPVGPVMGLWRMRESKKAMSKKRLVRSVELEEGGDWVSRVLVGPGRWSQATTKKKKGACLKECHDWGCVYCCVSFVEVWLWMQIREV